MKVRVVSLLVLPVLAAFAAPTAHAAAPAEVRMLSCAKSTDISGGSVTYVTRMDAVPGTHRMALRIRLLRKIGDGEFEPVTGSGLGVWRKSRPDASAFRWEHSIEGLAPGAVYRAVVRYRWFGDDGETILSARRRSAKCHQPAGLPNLRIDRITSNPGEVEGTAVYKVTISNPGAVAAQDVGVLLRVDGEVVDDAVVIDKIGPNQTRTVTFNGPVCRRHMRVVVDPKDTIAESREEDNTRDPSCL
ncbi:MAG: CARDB domain-containing protein [Thermoleophilaceae bacterium]